MDSAEYASRVDELERYLGAAFTHAEATYQRLERELHGRTSQRLVALALDLRVQEASTSAGTPEHENLTRVISAITEMAAELRLIEQSIFPSILIDAGIPAGLRSLSRRATILVDVHAADVVRFPLAIELAVFRATSAAIDHYTTLGARRVDVTVAIDESCLRLTIASDAGAEDDDPFGLIGRGQIAAAGGRTSDDRLPDDATAIVATFERSRSANPANGG